MQNNRLNRREFLKQVSINTFALTMAGCLNASSNLKTGKTRRPNVIIFLTDDQGFSDVGFHGNSYVRTPNLDKLAENSVELTNFYVSPVCSPTRASLLTGRYHHRTGVLDVTKGMSSINPDEITLDAGYATGIYGKWHLGDSYPCRPIDQGFEKSLIHRGGMIGTLFNSPCGDSYFDPELIQNGQVVYEKGYSCDIFCDKAIQFIEKNQDHPFFLFLSTNTPHHPLTVSDQFADPYREMGLSEETSRYYGMISNIDYNFGKIQGKLRQLNLEQDTIILFLGDNGTSGQHEQEDLYRYGLRGAKSYVYENGIRVPCCWYWPGKFKKGKKVNTIAAHIDIMPTILDACHLQKPSNCFDGVSLMSLLTDKKQEHLKRNLYFQSNIGFPNMKIGFAVRTQKYKLLQAARNDKEAQEMNYQLELYDIENDPFEQNNLVEKQPLIVDDLFKSYNAWAQEMKRSIPDPHYIPVGTDYENPVMLTRLDWKNAVGIIDLDCSPGYWLIDVRVSGNYRIRLKTGKVIKQTVSVFFRMADVEIDDVMLYAETECILENIFLTSGKTELHTWYVENKSKSSFRFVEIEKL